MGAADIVPGVSGGTIALVLGIYRRLVASIRAGSSAIGEAMRGRGTRAVEWLRTVEWSLVLPLAVGIILAVLALSHFLETQLEQAPVQMSALFLGLVFGSAVVAWRLLLEPTGRLGWIVAASAVITFVVLGVRESTTPDAVDQAGSVTLPLFFLAAMFAVTAMILPGVSGSFLLVIVGMYGPVLAAVNDRAILELAVFVAGAIVGLALFSQVLHRALEGAHDVVMALLIGLMVGSLRVLWPWPDGVESTALNGPDDHIAVSILLAIVGFAAVLGISALSQAQLHSETAVMTQLEPEQGG